MYRKALICHRGEFVLFFPLLPKCVSSTSSQPVRRNVSVPIKLEQEEKPRFSFSLRREGLKQHSRTVLEAISKSISNPASFEFVYNFLQIILQKSDATPLFKSVLDTLSQDVFAFFEFSLECEVNACLQKTTLFRGHSVVVACFAHFVRDLDCYKYLCSIIRPVIDSLVQEDAESLQSEELIKDYANEFLTCVQSHVAPPILCRLLLLVQRFVSSKFPEMQWQVVASMLFLRFIVPAMCTVQDYCKRKVSLEVQKYFVRLGRFVQNYMNNEEVAQEYFANFTSFKKIGPLVPLKKEFLSSACCEEMAALRTTLLQYDKCGVLDLIQRTQT